MTDFLPGLGPATCAAHRFPPQLAAQLRPVGHADPALAHDRIVVARDASMMLRLPTSVTADFATAGYLPLELAEGNWLLTADAGNERNGEIVARIVAGGMGNPNQIEIWRVGALSSWDASIYHEEVFANRQGPARPLLAPTDPGDYPVVHVFSEVDGVAAVAAQLAQTVGEVPEFRSCCSNRWPIRRELRACALCCWPYPFYWLCQFRRAMSMASVRSLQSDPKGVRYIPTKTLQSVRALLTVSVLRLVIDPQTNPPWP